MPATHGAATPRIAPRWGPVVYNVSIRQNIPDSNQRETSQRPSRPRFHRFDDVSGQNAAGQPNDVVPEEILSSIRRNGVCLKVHPDILKCSIAPIACLTSVCSLDCAACPAEWPIRSANTLSLC